LQFGTFNVSTSVNDKELAEAQKITNHYQLMTIKEQEPNNSASKDLSEVLQNSPTQRSTRKPQYSKK